MNAQTITDRLNAKSDRDLMDELRATVAPFWKACGERSATRPPLSPELKQAMGQVTATSGTEGVPWHGAVQELFVQAMFAYMRERRRSERISEFLGHVEAVKDYIPPEG